MSEKRVPQHLIRLNDLSPQQVDDLLELSTRLKRKGTRAELAGRTVGLLFFRGSLRTRASFEAAMVQLGGNTINLTAASDFWDLEVREGAVMDGRAPEHIRDAAAVLSSYVNALAIRPKPAGRSWAEDRKDSEIRSWADHARVPVINMESALWHPLQALADLMTLRETLGDVRGKRLSVVWTHSPTPATPAVVHSLVHGAVRAGMHVRVAHPQGYELDTHVLEEVSTLAKSSGGSFETGLPLIEGVRGSHVVYARSWESLEDYGNPTLAASRRSRQQGWAVDERLMAQGADARLMHAMPVRRNLEVTDEVLDGPRSLIVQQAENRLHSQKALLTHMLRG
ncbi:MAG: N-acetylornithine carbamoyltransferase [Planctomycetes bacterium]|nr:N-acetylornithine carbamoyltransferase [Planctomycetota bacterium]